MNELVERALERQTLKTIQKKAPALDIDHMIKVREKEVENAKK